MIIVGDASVLVAEMLRKRGRALILHPAPRVVVAEHQWREARHELGVRVAKIVKDRGLSADDGNELLAAALGVVESGAIEVVSAEVYAGMETVALSRVPRDPDDGPTVALALTLNVGILTSDKDFLGCGCPTWTPETLRDELGP